MEGRSTKTKENNINTCIASNHSKQLAYSLYLLYHYKSK